MTDLPTGAKPTPLPAPRSPLPDEPVSAARSEALEAELAMLEAILPTEAKGPPKDGGDTR